MKYPKRVTIRRQPKAPRITLPKAAPNPHRIPERPLYMVKLYNGDGSVAYFWPKEAPPDLHGDEAVLVQVMEEKFLYGEEAREAWDRISS